MIEVYYRVLSTRMVDVAEQRGSGRQWRTRWVVDMVSTACVGSLTACSYTTRMAWSYTTRTACSHTTRDDGGVLMVYHLAPVLD